MTRYTKGKLALKILYLISAGVLIPVSMVAPNMLKVYVPLLRRLAKKLNSKPYAIRRSITYMKRERLLRVEEKGDETHFVLAEEGRRRVVKGNFDNLHIPEPKRWDRKWRVVIFDIPEEHKKARESLREKLKELGFYKLQKSCFVYPFECREQVDFITEFFQISQHINYLVVESLEGNKYLPSSLIYNLFI